MAWIGRDLKDHLVPALLTWAGLPARRHYFQSSHFNDQASFHLLLKYCLFVAEIFFFPLYLILQKLSYMADLSFDEKNLKCILQKFIEILFQNLRITEPLTLEKTTKTIKSNHSSNKIQQLEKPVQTLQAIFINLTLPGKLCQHKIHSRKLAL